MARIKLNPVLSSIDSSVGDLVFYTRRGVQCARKRVVPANPDTEKQRACRNSFTLAVDLWKGIGGIMRGCWNGYAGSGRHTGYAVFMGVNIKRLSAGLGAELFREFGEAPLLSLSCAPGSRPGEIECFFTLPGGISGRHVTLFMHGRPSGRPFAVARHDLGADPSPPYTIRGLDPGGLYSIYGIITDRPYQEAETCSLSIYSESPAL